MRNDLVSVVIPNWNGREHLFTCLSSLQNQVIKNYEILLVDNGSTDGSINYVCENFPEVRIIKSDVNLGFAGGCNLGIENASGDYIALLNNDTEVDKNWLAQSVNALKENPEAGLTASRILLFHHRKYIDTAGDLYFRSGFPGKRGSFSLDGQEFDQYKWVFGACAGAAVYRRDLFAEIGPFDEDFFSFMEDVDLSFRAQLAGYRCLYVPTAIVYHKLGATAGLNDPRRQRWSHRNRWYTLIKNLPAELWMRNIGHILVAEIVILGSTIFQLRLGNYIRARVDVLKNLTKMLGKRREIQNTAKVSNGYIYSIMSKGWFSHRILEKQNIKQVPIDLHVETNSS